MKITAKSFFGLGLAALLAIAAYAAESSYTCSVSQGFNFEKDSQAQVGHINYLKIGDTALNSDLSVTDPADVKKTVKVFGVVSSIYWKGGYANPVQFSAQVSVDNKNKLATLQHKTLSNTEVEIQFTVYDYDHKVKKYFKCFHSNSIKLKGLVLKSGGELAMNIDMDQSSEVPSPKNHAFSLGVMPQDLAQEIHLAFAESNKLVKKWGVAVAK
jgi:hypothetical protein